MSAFLRDSLAVRLVPSNANEGTPRIFTRAVGGHVMDGPCYEVGRGS